MINAFVICDFDNPLSMRYLSLTQESFSRVEDIITLHPVQCTKPDTLPAPRFPKRRNALGSPDCPDWVDAKHPHIGPRYYGGTFNDGPIYQAIMHSQHKLIKRIADGEELAIMEHDAAIVNYDSFRRMFDEHWGKVDLFMPGTCMEFYGMSQRFAQRFDEVLMSERVFRKRIITGPFGLIDAMCAHGMFDDWLDDMNCLVPTKAMDDIDMQCYGEEPRQCTYAMGEEMYPPGCKQFLFVKDGEAQNTNAFKYDPNKPMFEQMQQIPGMNPGGGGYDASRDFVLLEWPE